MSLHPSLAYGRPMTEAEARSAMSGRRAAFPRFTVRPVTAQPARAATRAPVRSLRPFVESLDPVMPAGTHRVCGDPDPLITGWSCYLDSGHPGVHRYES